MEIIAKGAEAILIKKEADIQMAKIFSSKGYLINY